MQTPPPYMTKWSDQDLEYIESCPICKSQERRLLCDDLRDYFFECAPGSWAMHQCKNCGCGYLNPRPSQSSIGLAYSSYYTHKDESKNSNTIGRNYWHQLRDDYLSKKYNTLYYRSLWPGRWIIYLLPYRKLYIDNVFTRNLPIKSNEHDTLLDVGCGNGNFLLFAKNIGWNVRGVDFDPLAVRIAQEKGLNVAEGSIDLLSQESSCYDFITLSHVLEHVPDPTKMLSDCYRLLKPNGILWIDTPNIDSNGFKKFQSYWRGLEPPRHLTLFNRRSLVKKLLDTGFTNIQDKFSTYTTKTLWNESKNIARKAGETEKLSYSIFFLKIAQIKAALLPDTREFITVYCVKPK